MIKAMLVIAEAEEGAVPLASLPCPGDVINARLKNQWQQLRVMHTEHIASDDASAVLVMPRVHCVQIAETVTDG